MDFPSGFGITGVISEGSDSLALITAPAGMRAAAVFTTNKLKAHPVLYSSKILSGKLHNAVLVNRGSANAATGTEGRKKLKELVAAVSERTAFSPETVLAASTGVIGKQINCAEENIDTLCSDRDAGKPVEFAKAIMTTDTREKTAWGTCEIGGEKITVFGVAKGSGMISPQMATMLAFIMTDADISKEMLQKAVKEVSDKSFNRVIVDGDTSTNDTVFLLSSCKASNRQIKKKSKSYDILYSCLERVCITLAEMLASDGEGASKMVKVKVRGAASDNEARKAARAIAVSPLCKTAFYGASPNWGRIASAIGAAGIDVNLSCFSIYANGVSWLTDGKPASTCLPQLREVLQGAKYELDIVLGSGKGKSKVYTCDYTPEYVRINAHYLS